jgi:hypothetical protein
LPIPRRRGLRAPGLRQLSVFELSRSAVDAARYRALPLGLSRWSASLIDSRVPAFKLWFGSSECSSGACIGNRGSSVVTFSARRTLAVGVIFLAILSLADVSHASAPPRQQPVSATSQSATTTQATETSESGQIKNLRNQVSSFEKILNLVLLPIAVLIGILCAGGVIGVVFSVRDQRRVSQLHELTVSSEMAAQRRTEQSHNTFLSESQKTLTLVNDTLALAKEANEQAAHKMQVKAGDNLAAIEQRAEDLILDIIETGDFEEVVDIPEHRLRLRSIASELGSIEGYLRLQGIPLPPYSRFVKGIEQFLDGAIAGSLQTLRHAALDSSNRQLQRFSLYWAAKLNNAVGNYEHAENLFEQAVEHAGEDTVERYELERAHLETEFFRIADTSKANTPAQRLEQVTRTLGKLEIVSEKLDAKAHDYKDQHSNHEVAATRADIYTWVAHDPEKLCHQLPKHAIANAKKLSQGHAFDGVLSTNSDDDKATLDLVLNLDSEEIRAWALLQALRIYIFQHDSHEQSSHATTGIDFSLLFGKAECHFALRDEHDIVEYNDLKHKALEQEQGSHREHRWTVELAQISLICKVRLLSHEQDREGSDVASLEGEVGGAYAHLQDVLHGAPDHNVTIFSHIQRRNLDEEEFRLEADALRRQALKLPSPSDGVHV